MTLYIMLLVDSVYGKMGFFVCNLLIKKLNKIIILILIIIIIIIIIMIIIIKDFERSLKLGG